MDERSDEEDSLEGVCGERFPCCGVDGRHVGMSCFQVDVCWSLYVFEG